MKAIQDKIKNPFLALVYEYVALIIGAVLLASMVRAVWFEPFKIPSTSMVPTLLVGDYLFVDKNNYGLRNPCSGERYFADEEDAPKRGDVVVFTVEKGPACGFILGLGNLNYIKRIVAVPGDRVAYYDKKLYVNGEEIPMTFKQNISFKDATNHTVRAREYDVNFNGLRHGALTMDDRPAIDVEETVVPAGKYVVMGDNRDNSYDSRFWTYPQWGYVDAGDIVGQAKYIFWSWDQKLNPRTERVGQSLVAKEVE